MTQYQIFAEIRIKATGVKDYILTAVDDGKYIMTFSTKIRARATYLGMKKQGKICELSGKEVIEYAQGIKAEDIKNKIIDDLKNTLNPKFVELKVSVNGKEEI